MTSKRDVKKNIQSAFEILSVAYDAAIKGLDEVKDFDTEQLRQVVSGLRKKAFEFDLIMEGIEREVHGL